MGRCLVKNFAVWSTIIDDFDTGTKPGKGKNEDEEEVS